MNDIEPRWIEDIDIRDLISSIELPSSEIIVELQGRVRLPGVGLIWKGKFLELLIKRQWITYTGANALHETFQEQKVNI